MYREIYLKLLEWKKEKGHKPLVLNGARQVGKTYILKEFGRAEYVKMAYVNLDKDGLANEIFTQDHNVRRIIRALSAHTNVDIVPGKTLIFIDEIQDCPQALTALKYFREDAPDYDIVVAGSLLGITLNKDQTFPVGDVDILQMYPMTFNEFLIATGNGLMERAIKERDWSVVGPLRSEFTNLLRQYYYVGGMPEAVNAYIENKGLFKVRKIQKDILAGYRKDFSKHAPTSEVPRINSVWDSIPSQLAKENRKFIYGAVRQGSRAKDYEIAIQWLVDAGLVYKVHRVTKLGIPLKFYEELEVFKLFMLDVGLMGAMVDAPAALMLNQNAVFSEFKGAFTELYVCMQLKEMELPVYYHSTNDSLVEIDFAVQIQARSIPIEVKAEENTKSKSLKTFLEENRDLKAIRFSMKDYYDADRIENIPLYAISSIK